MALPSHAVPQNILEVEFQLFGSLTIKQFGYIAGGIGLALVTYWIFGKIPIIQWPLSLIFFFGGVALALWKINEMPLEVYLINYITAIFTTQRSIYQKSKKTTSIFDILDKSTAKINSKKSPYEESGLAYVNLNYNNPRQSAVDSAEESDLKDIDDLFGNIFNQNQKSNSAEVNSYFENYDLVSNFATKEKASQTIDKKNITLKPNSTDLTSQDISTDLKSSFHLITNNKPQVQTQVVQTNLNIKPIANQVSSSQTNLLQVTESSIINQDISSPNSKVITRFQLDDIDEPITNYTQSKSLPIEDLNKKQDLTSFLQDSAARLVKAQELEKKKK